MNHERHRYCVHSASDPHPRFRTLSLLFSTTFTNLAIIEYIKARAETDEYAFCDLHPSNFSTTFACHSQMSPKMANQTHFFKQLQVCD